MLHTGYETQTDRMFSIDDRMAERSKALRSGRSLVRGVGSNPTSVKNSKFIDLDTLAAATLPRSHT